MIDWLHLTTSHPRQISKIVEVRAVLQALAVHVFSDEAEPSDPLCLQQANAVEVAQLGALEAGLIHEPSYHVARRCSQWRCQGASSGDYIGAKIYAVSPDNYGLAA